ncbi:protein FAM200A-like [Palaemon carinicauda]|uniref:protein FAM200A-like n=1 Tax=Palaemon carinicauda TaxID=392227 RepID=UPI0035B5F88B
MSLNALARADWKDSRVGNYVVINGELLKERFAFIGLLVILQFLLKEHWIFRAILDGNENHCMNLFTYDIYVSLIYKLDVKYFGSPFATKFTDKEWLARLCYLADIFAVLNSGNLQLQGRNTTVIDARHTVAAFLAKLRLWIRRLEKGVIAQFPTLDQFIEENSHETGSLLQTINKEMSDHLKGLETSMHHYFPESDQETASLQWIIHPFSVPDEAIHDDDFPGKEEWITMRANEALKIEFQNQNADSFWISRLADSPTLSKRALKLLVSFSTTYLCEKGFSTVLGMKTKKRTRLNVANDARLALSTTKPRIPQLASNMQLQPSH